MDTVPDMSSNSTTNSTTTSTTSLNEEFVTQSIVSASQPSTSSDKFAAFQPIDESRESFKKRKRNPSELAAAVATNSVTEMDTQSKNNGSDSEDDITEEQLTKKFDANVTVDSPDSTPVFVRTLNLGSTYFTSDRKQILDARDGGETSIVPRIVLPLELHQLFNPAKRLTQKKAQLESLALHLHKCITEGFIPSNFLLKLRPSYGVEDDAFLKEWGLTLRVFSNRLMENTLKKEKAKKKKKI